MPATTRPRDRRVAALLGGAALIGATATMAVAAQTSLPGESLYGVKRGIESAQVQLAGDDAARGRTLLAQAGTRLTELEELSAGGGTEQLIPDTLDTFTEQSGEGVRSLLTAYSASGSDADVQVAREFTSTSMDRLEALAGPSCRRAPSDELLAAGRTLTDLDTEISTACGLCPGGLTSTPDFVLSSAPTDLLTGLDSDELTLEAAPRRSRARTSPASPSRKALQSPGALLPEPSVSPTVPVKTPQVVVPESTTSPTRPSPTRPRTTRPSRSRTSLTTSPMSSPTAC